MKYIRPDVVLSNAFTPPAADEAARYRDLAIAILSAPAAAEPLAEIEVEPFLAAVERDGLLGLLYDAVSGTGLAERLPPTLLDGLRTAAHRQAARELVQRLELQRVIAALHDEGVEALLMKGASLAYQLYRDPAWRVRSDVDLMVRGNVRGSARRCLEQLGYSCEPEVSGRLVTYQFHAERIDARGVRHLFDVHWKVANPQRFADAIAFEELAGRAVPLPALGPAARGLGRADALWLACIHRAAHHYDQQTPVWLYDVHLLVRALDGESLAIFVALAKRTGVRRICLRALTLARARFGTPTPPEIMAALDAAPDDEPSTLFLRPGLRRVDVLLDDLRALRGWPARVTLLKEHLLPDAAYMRRTYARGSTAPIAWLYLRRIAAGTAKWFRS